MTDILDSLMLDSPAFDAVSVANHPSPEEGGPCDTCAFRQATEASLSRHTVALARACVEGLTPFECHEEHRLCRGWIAAANLRGPIEDEDDRRRVTASAFTAKILSDAINAGVEADRLQLTEAKCNGQQAVRT